MAAPPLPPLSVKALDRFLSNPYLDADPLSLLATQSSSPPSLPKDFAERLLREAAAVTAHIAGHIGDSPKFAQKTDVYSGVGGVAYMYLEIHFHNKVAIEGAGVTTHPLSPLQFARQFLHKPPKRAEGSDDKPSLLCGRPGYYALLTVLEYEDGRRDRSDKALAKLLRLRSLCLPVGRDVCNEHLNGRAGYLAALLYVKRRLAKDDLLLSPGVSDVITAILEDGKRFAEEFRASSDGKEWKVSNAESHGEGDLFSPLLFPWHGKYYLGVAHGTLGILLTLLSFHLPPPSLSLLVQTARHIQAHCRFCSGNYSTRHYHTEGDDRLVQLCHGAAGAAVFFAKAFEILGMDEFRKAAEEAGEVVWQRGLLKKGFGLCHGISGNGLVFLSLYHATHNPLWLGRAAFFGKFSLDWKSLLHVLHTPDRPLSLFEGLAGLVVFFLHLSCPEAVHFPAVDE